MNNQSQARYFEVSPEVEVKKCSRCRVKRTEESPELLNKYATCISCRERRRVVKMPVDLTNVPNLYTNYEEFLDKIKSNVSQDIISHLYKGETDPSIIRRFDTEVDNVTYQQISKQLIDIYINPLMIETGYRFPVRDYHKGGGKTKKITFMFICSQDRGRQRKSRSTDQRTVPNRLKTHICHSKINLNYRLNDGVITISYTHKAHPPYSWKRTREGEERGENSSNQYLEEQYQEQTRHVLESASNEQQQLNALEEQQRAPLPSMDQRYVVETTSNNYSTQLQNISQFNNQLHFGQFHIPLTQQYQAVPNSQGSSAQENTVSTGLSYQTDKKSD